MIFHLVIPAISTAIIVGGPLWILANHWRVERDESAVELGAARALLRQLQTDAKALRDKTRSSRVNNQNRGSILPPAPNQGQ